MNTLPELDFLAFQTVFCRTTGPTEKRFVEVKSKAQQRNIVVLGGLFMCWAGLVIGVSFIATPAKFLAPSLDLPTALDVGRATFNVLSAIEVGALLCITLLIRNTSLRPLRWTLAALAAILSFQYLNLLPELSRQVSAIQNGAPHDGRATHLFYVLLETLKLGCLILSGTIAMRYSSSLAKQHA